MAQTIPCDICQSTPADFMVSNVHNGDTLGLCADDVPTWGEAIKSALQGAQEAPDGVMDGPDGLPVPVEPYDGPEGVSGEPEPSGDAVPDDPTPASEQLVIDTGTGPDADADDTGTD